MTIHTLCPKCKKPIAIDITKQLDDLIEQRAEDKAEPLADRKLQQIKSAFENEIRTDERKRVTKNSTKLQKTNDQLSRRITKLTEELQQQQRTVDAKVARLIHQGIHDAQQNWQNEQASANQEKNLEIAELRKQLRDAERATHDLKAKLKQGSAQEQGLIAENDLYAQLKKHLSSDCCSVEKIGQGRKGTDILLRIHQNNKSVGTIIVEGKWAEKWDTTWPEKVWNDQRAHNADIAYIAAKAAAFPNDPSLQQAGFGFAPCRRAGIQIYLINQSNLPLVINILTDGIYTLLMKADIEAAYGTGSDQLKQFRDYLARGYQNDLREKANHMSSALKSLQALHDKVDREYSNIKTALGKYWATERQQFHSVMAPWNKNNAKDISQLPFIEGI